MFKYSGTCQAGCHPSFSTCYSGILSKYLSFSAWCLSAEWMFIAFPALCGLHF